MQTKQKDDIDFEITNIVSAGYLGLELDLFLLAQKIKEIEYEPEQFPGAILKFKDPKASLLLFKNGKAVCVGCKDEKTIENVLVKTYNLLKPYAKVIKTQKTPTFQITNIVASGNLHINIDLFEIAYKLKDVEYEPEQFPGAILKFRDSKVSLLLFKNGKVIAAGATSEKQIKEVLKKAKELLLKFK